MSDNLKMIEGILEEQGLSQEQMADIMFEISQVDLGEIDPTMPVRKKDIGQTEMELRMAMDKESDWRIKAKLAARIIGMNLE